MLVWYFVPPPSIPARCHYRGIPSSSPIDSSPPKSAAAAAAAALFFPPPKSRPACSHHLQDTLSPGLQSDHSQRSIIVRVEIYCGNVFCLLVMYFQIPSKPASTIASSNGGYYQLPPPVSLDASRWAVTQTCVENYQGPDPSWGLATTSPPRTTTPPASPLKKIPDTFGSAPPGSISAKNAPNFSSPYEGCLPLQVSNHLSPSSSVPGT